MRGIGGAFVDANAPNGKSQNEGLKCDGKANTKTNEKKINDFIGVINHIFGSEIGHFRMYVHIHIYFYAFLYVCV